MRSWTKDFKLVLYCIVFFVITLCVASSYSYHQSLKMQVKTASTSAHEMVYASGDPVGIYIKTTGVLVLGTKASLNGKEICPCKGKIQAGDYILKLNGIAVNTKKEFQDLLQRYGAEELILSILRNEQETEVKVNAMYIEESESYQLGIWIRSDTQGIGTVTYVKEDGSFTALGHEIHDVDIGVPLKIEGGHLYETNISKILRGENGNPGEMIGSIPYTKEAYLGEITSNTPSGIGAIL